MYQYTEQVIILSLCIHVRVHTYAYESSTTKVYTTAHCKHADGSDTQETHGLAALEAVVLRDEVSNASKWMAFNKEEAEVLSISVALLRMSLKKHQFPYFQNESDAAKKSVSVFGDAKLDRCFFDIFKHFDQSFSQVKMEEKRWMLTTGSLSFVNVWDIGVNKGVYEVVGTLAPECQNVIVLDHFSLTDDVDSIDNIPNLDAPRYNGRYKCRKDAQNTMKLQTKFRYLCYPLFVFPDNDKSFLLVGTHNGLLQSEIEQKSKKVLQTVKIQADSHNRSHSLMPYVVPVQQHKKEDIESLRHTLEEMFAKNKQYLVELPLKWGFLRTYLASRKELYITLPELKVIAKKLHISDEEEVNDFLKVFSNCGSLIHISGLCPECADEYVILKPAEFLKEVEKLYYIETASGAQVSEVLMEKQKKGYISKRLAEALWTKQARSDCTHSFFIHALRRLGILAALKGKKDDKSTEKSDKKLEKYFMPTIRSKAWNEDPTHDSLFLPHGVVFPFHLQSQFLMYFQEVLADIVKFDPTDSFNTLRFWNRTGIGSKYLTLCFMGRYIEICGENFSKTFRSMIKTACIQVMAGIQDSKPKLHLDSLAIMCPSHTTRPVHFVEFHPLECVGELFCNKCLSMVDVTGGSLEWLQSLYTGPRSLVQCPEGEVVLHAVCIRHENNGSVLK